MNRPPGKHRLEFAFFRSLQWCFRVLPLPLAYRLSEAMTLLVHELFGWRKAATTARMRQVRPDLSPAGIAKSRREAARNLGRNLVEILRADKLDDRWADAHIDMNNSMEALAEARGAGKGVLLVIAHFGNWDLGGTIVCRRGVPMCFIARKQKNPLTYQALVHAREHSGGTVIDRDDPKLIRKVLSRLENNEVVAILVDIRSRGEGECCRFLGQNAKISNGLGLLAAKSGAQVLTVALRREGRSRHVWKCFPAQCLQARADKEARKQLLQNCLDHLSTEILQHPESYFWLNKRWVLDSGI